MRRKWKTLNEFKDGVSAYVPGLLVLFDLADEKRRMCHLGDDVFEKDIEEFEQLVQSSVGSAGLARRVDWFQWLAIYSAGSLQSLDALIATYHRQQEMQIGWRCTGDKDGVEKVVERTVPATIVRSVHCLYSTVINPQEIDGLIEKLFEQCWDFTPNVPMQLSAAIKAEKPELGFGWECVSRYPSEKPFCPFCEGRDFEWEDGDDMVYSGSGTCKKCGSDIDIRQVDILQ